MVLLKGYSRSLINLSTVSSLGFIYIDSKTNIVFVLLLTPNYKGKKNDKSRVSGKGSVCPW